MKKNLLGILILGLTFINLIVSGITLFSVFSTNQKTAKVVADVADAISIDLGTGASDSESSVKDVPIENIQTYAIPEKMTIALKPSEGDDGSLEEHYCMATIFFSMNIEDPDFKKYGTTLEANENLLRSIITETFAQYTVDEARLNREEIRREILKKVQDKYSGSEFVFDVSFSDILFQ